MDNKALFNLSYGLYVISAKDGERNTGCVANSVFQVASSPATLALSINKNNFTTSCIQNTGRFSVSILSEKVNKNVIGVFGFSSGKEKNKFENFKYTTTESNIAVLADGVCSFIECKVISATDCFTHILFTAEITDAKILSKEPPMTYAYYHEVVKGKAPKNAPTYIEEEKSEKSAKSVYVCSLCGYEYTDDDFETLPDSYKCPVCNAAKALFERSKTHI